MKKVLVILLAFVLLGLVGCKDASGEIISGQNSDEGKQIINASILDANGTNYALSGKVSYQTLERVGQLGANLAFTGTAYSGYIKVEKTIDGDPVTYKYGVYSLYDDAYVIEANFDSVYIDNDYISKGYIRVGNSSKYGIYSLTGTLIVPIEYDVIAQVNAKYIIASKTIIVGSETKYEYTIFDNTGSISYSPITNTSGTLPNLTITSMYYSDYVAYEKDPSTYTGYVIEKWATNVGVLKYFKLENNARTEFSYGHFVNDPFENMSLLQWSPRWKNVEFYYETVSNLNSTIDYVFYNGYGVDREEVSRFTYDSTNMSTMEFSDKIVYQTVKEVADDAKDFTFFDNGSKYKVYSYAFNIADGKVKALDLDYIVGSTKIAMLNSENLSAYIYSFVFRIADKVIADSPEHWLIDNNGKLLQRFTNVSPISAQKVIDNRYIISGKLVDGDLGIITDFANSSIMSVTENVIVLGHATSFGVIDLEGNIVHEFKYKEIGSFYNGFARATLYDNSFIWLGEDGSTRDYSTTLSYDSTVAYGYTFEQVTQEEVVYYKIYSYGEAIVGTIANFTNVTVSKKDNKCLLKVITASSDTEYYVLS